MATSGKSVPESDLPDASASASDLTGNQWTTEVIQDFTRHSNLSDQSARVGSPQFEKDVTNLVRELRGPFQFKSDGSATLSIESGDTLSKAARLILRQSDPTNAPADGKPDSRILSIINRLKQENSVTYPSFLLSGADGNKLQVGWNLKIPADLIERKKPTEVRPLPGEPGIHTAGASPGFAKEVADIWRNEIPQALQDKIIGKGGRIVVTGDLRDYDPKMAFQQAPGYGDGFVLSSLAGMYTGDFKPGRAGDLIINEKILNPTTGRFEHYRSRDNPDKNDSRRTVLHETMHALDQSLGNFSESNQMLEKFSTDFAALKDFPQKGEFPFSAYLQGVNWNTMKVDDTRGVSELFADLSCAALGLPSPLQNPEQLARFKNTYSLVMDTLVQEGIMTPAQRNEQRRKVGLSPIP